ncbi:MAG: hypothetical protein IT211_00995 [Armatimonadetes bacterium]|nr:hypothetical protein [Armatimonadota bacterium]
MKFLLLLPLVFCSCFPVRKYFFVEPESNSNMVKLYQDPMVSCNISITPEVGGRVSVRTELHAAKPECYRVEDCVVELRCADDKRRLPRIFNYELFSWHIAQGVSDTTLKDGYRQLPDTSRFRDPRYTIVQQFQRGDCEQLLVTLRLRLRNLPFDTTLVITETRQFLLKSKVEIETIRGH